MRTVVGLFIVIAGLGMVGEPWYAHLIVVALGVLVILSPTDEPS